MLLQSYNIKGLDSNGYLIFVITDSGLEVIDKLTLTSKSFVTMAGGFTCVYAQTNYNSSDCVYLGTVSNGIYKILVSDIHRGGDVTAYCSQFLTQYSAPIALSSNNIISLHGKGTDLAVLYPNSVNYIVPNTSQFLTNFVGTISKGSICITETNDLYYTNNQGVNAVYNIGSNWSTPSYTYSTSSTLPIGSNIVNGLYVSPATSSPSNNSYGLNNTLYIGTADGFYIINEEKGNEYNGTSMSFGATSKTYNILDSNSCLVSYGDRIPITNYGRCYVGTDNGTVYIIDVSNKVVLCSYKVDSGCFNDHLNSGVLKALITV